MTNKLQSIYIVGQTATGKSDLALQIAKRYDGELICADSRTVYRQMNIGTAKPSLQDQARVRHWGLDLVNPDQQFTAADFKCYAQAAIADIQARAKLPIIVGGSGLYIDALLYDFTMLPADPVLRAKLNQLSIEELQSAIRHAGYAMPENYQNKRYLIRTLERQGSSGQRSAIDPATLVLGLREDPVVLKLRISQRVASMLQAGFISEAEHLFRQYPADAPGLQAPGYKAYRDSQANLYETFVHNDYQLAKRQLTWFKRNKSIHWLDNSDKLAQTEALITTFSQK